MPSIYKLNPLSTISLRGFDGFGAAAAIHQATSNSFVVSGVFRYASDFCVLIIYDTNDFFSHPRHKYLPDPDLSGLVLQFDVQYRNLMPLDSPKFPTIDWPYLDVTRQDGTSAQIPLFEHAQLISGDFTAADGSFTVKLSGLSAVAGDKIDLWFQNIAFSYTCVGGESAAAIVQALCTQINTLDWSGIAGLNALWGFNENGGRMSIEFARYGKVSTNGRSVTLQSGNSFVGLVAPQGVLIGGTFVSITSMTSTILEVDTDLGVQTGVAYLAVRGGRDGNMVTMYARTSGTISIDSPAGINFVGGNSDVTWRVTLDFTALGIDSVRQMWLTFAPRLSFAGPYQAEEWDATFSNWSVTPPVSFSNPDGNRLLQVAGPGSVRVDCLDSWAKTKGPGWTITNNGGFYSQGFAIASSTSGDSATVQYSCQFPHEVWLGTALYVDRGKVSISIDGGAAVVIDTYLNSLDPVVTRVKASITIPAGEHTVTITKLDAKPFYFDFLEAVVASDMPADLEPLPHLGVAIDSDTDSTYKYPPQRLLIEQNRLGVVGPMDHYEGVFFWNQRKAVGGNIPSALIKLAGNFLAGDQIFVLVGGLTIGKTVFSGDTLAVIATHLVYFANEVFSGAWAQVAMVDGYPAVQITSHSGSPAYNFSLTASATSAGGAVSVVGSLQGGIVPTWEIDETVSPVLNYAARCWLADLYRECAAWGRRIVTAFSMELVNPPDGWAQLYPDGSKPDLDTGFSSLKATQCSFIRPVLYYQVQAYLEVASLQKVAGLTPELQLGEFSWWYFAGPGGMAFYDDTTKALARGMLGRDLYVWQSADDDPFARKDDADFLANRLASYVMSIVLAVKTRYPSALFEWLLPMDVNAKKVQGRYNLGGRLLNYINIPEHLIDPNHGIIDILKIEALDNELGSRSLDLAREAMAYPAAVGWPADRVRFLVGCSNPGAPFHHALRAARDAGIGVVCLWAFDHVLLFGEDVRKEVPPGGEVV